MLKINEGGVMMNIFVQPLRSGRKWTYAILTDQFTPDYPFPAKWSVPGFVPNDMDLMWKELVEEMQGKPLWLTVWLNVGLKRHTVQRSTEEYECDVTFNENLMSRLAGGWEAVGSPFVLEVSEPADGWSETAELWAVGLLPQMVAARKGQPTPLAV